ncbi:MAG: hypothetical protein CVT72_07490 [Alphaproteobacteria bacterium HGW-Alphaproteobacteria-11]|nr:MAG: hypothetical protein CVT72_07490 [Alphaproteobacteria bacterium HGW-Alphaproteobacteria-11]
MTTTARQVLEDCAVALQLLEEEQDLQRWRILWAGAVSLLRAVGSVLKKVDARDDPLLTSVADKHHNEWKKEAAEHQIFREFIENERNNILKEYKFGIHPLEDVGVVIQLKFSPPGGGEPQYLGQIFNLDENIYRPMLDNAWEGDDAREVYQEAIDWWRKQLDLIDAEVRSARSSQ